MTEAKPTPTPWRASKCGYLMGSDGEGPFGKREVQVAQVGNFFDKELLPFNEDRWQADLELIVRAVNSHDDLVKALNAACGYMRNASIDLSTGCTKATAIRTIEGGLKLVEAAIAKATGAA